MLAGEASPDVYTKPKDIGSESFGPLKLAGRIGVEQDKGMHVAVACVKNVCDLQAIFFGKLANAFKGVRKLRDGNGSVETQIVAEPSHRPECRLAPFPDRQRLICVAAGAKFHRVELFGNSTDMLGLAKNFVL